MRPLAFRFSGLSPRGLLSGPGVRTSDAKSTCQFSASSTRLAHPMKASRKASAVTLLRLPGGPHGVELPWAVKNQLHRAKPLKKLWVLRLPMSSKAGNNGASPRPRSSLRVEDNWWGIVANAACGATGMTGAGGAAPPPIGAGGNASRDGGSTAGRDAGVAGSGRSGGWGATTGATPKSGTSVGGSAAKGDGETCADVGGRAGDGRANAACGATGLTGAGTTSTCAAHANNSVLAK
mmetsp:Transcript_33905/g.74174  ORF Transcript_33905/g.74174 Transcript_33905/m.74174 type:complete len:236 (-) Transcript_33905:1141-1848(-)